MNHRSVQLSALGLFALVVFTACAHTDQDDGPVIKDLQIDGNEKVDDGDIKDKILTAETSWIPFSAKKRLDRNVWGTDLERIERYYRARGYYQAVIVDETIEPQGDDAVKIRVKVREGEPTKIARVNVQGLDALSEEHRKLIQREIALKEGDIFEEEKWTGLKEMLTEQLVSFGYAEAKVEGDAKVDLATQQAFIDVNVNPGQRYKPGPVTVTVQPGARVEAWRVEEQVREALEDEEWYSQEARTEAQQRVFDLGVFGAAQVTPLAGDPQTGRLPLQVEVQEAPFHEVAYGFGIGIEQRRNEGHLIAEYTNRDFMGGLRRLTLEGRAGWAFIPNAYDALRGGDSVTRNGPIALLAAELEQPRLFHPNFRLRTRVEAERAIEPAYSYTGGQARIGVPWKPWSWLEIEPSYNLEVYRLDEGGTSLTGDAPQLLFGCTGACVLSYLEQRFAFDRRDDPQEPHDGYYLALSLQEGGGPLGGTFDYLRVVPEARAYKSFLPAKRLTFAARVRTGSLIPLGKQTDLDSPIVARFFSGGDNHRGFSTQRLSPMRLVEKDEPTGEFTAEPVPIGGNGLFEASFETRYALTKAIVLAAFVDTGFVTTERIPLSRPDYFTSNLLWAVGTGVRYRTPVGPVRLDLAYRLPVGPALQVYETEGSGHTYLPAEGCFGIGRGSAGRGGAPEGACAIHLSIGEAF